MHSFLKLAFFITFYIFTEKSQAYLSPNFTQFTNKEFGEDVSKTLSRSDLGEFGSFGGGNGKLTRRKPIIFVHGITMTAGEMLSLKSYFESKGYTDEDLYATTYGPKGFPVTPYNNGSLKCEYAKAIRLMIQAVSMYRNSSVELITYSMGVVISRKAVLGGVCVDTKEDLGDALTNKVHTFIGIAGPNFGSILCSGFQQLNIGDSCNMNTGMICGSKYLNDINKSQRYEGKKIYVIQSIPDLIVGNYVCTEKKLTTEIDGADKSYTFYGMTHSTVWILTTSKQYELITANN